jgi:hypothetical protein
MLAAVLAVVSLESLVFAHLSRRIGNMSIRSIVIACAASVGSLLLVLGFAIAAGFNAKSIKGGYGCLGVINQGTQGISNVMQLSFDGQGAVTGQMSFFAAGDVCDASISGKYSVSANGMGTVTLTLSTSGQDPDNDFDCSTLNGISENMALVLEGKGKIFDFAALDDWVTNTDPKNTFTGSCKSQ